jgi:hypothetical protein
MGKQTLADFALLVAGRFRQRSVCLIRIRHLGRGVLMEGVQLALQALVVLRKPGVLHGQRVFRVPVQQALFIEMIECADVFFNDHRLVSKFGKRFTGIQKFTADTSPAEGEQDDG